MAEDATAPDALITGTGVSGLAVRVDETLQVATLRYFAREGEFASAVREVTALALPQSQRATVAPDGQLILAWRSPTETLCLAGAPARLAQLEARLGAATDGCLVNLTGALKVVRVSGARVRELLCRLGGTASVPQAGEARRSRLADVAVLAVCVQGEKEAEVWLLVDRAYAPHLLGWIRETVADFVNA
ncbi:MAG TPA: sarcosine oxidase subunit gamma family protein [Steroidobacteraceae bacterium]|nr:sarcosine oxidase subunit gamma family protein [Steroidobacteraceae bacterium]